MSFILWGAAAAVIPIIVHLLHRQKTVPLAWGAMQFLLETPLKKKRRLQVDHWLLMLLRMAILLLLAFVLARPIVQGVTFSTETPMDVVIVLDHSLSMSRRVPGAGGQGAGTLFDAALESAQRVAAILPKRASGGGATIGVVLAEHSPRVMTSLPVPVAASKSGGWPQVLQGLRELKAGMTDANIPLAIQAATELAARGPNLRKLVIVISDDQRSNWQPGDESAWGGKAGLITKSAAIPVYSLPVMVTASLPNLSVSNITVLPAFVGVHRSTQISAAITHTGGNGDLTNIPVQLQIDSQTVATQHIARLSPGQSNTIRFSHTFGETGSHAIRIKADVVDALDADNAGVAAVTVSPKLPVLVVDGQVSTATSYPAAQYLLFAMQPDLGFDSAGDANAFVIPKTISVSELATTRLEDFPIIVLNDVPRFPAELARRLADHVQQGNGLWIILGPRTESAFLNNILGKTALFPATAGAPVRIAVDAPALAADIQEPENAAFAALTAAQQNALAGVNFRAWWPVKATSPNLRTVLATTSVDSRPGDPLILETDVGKAGGRVVIWTSPDYSPLWNNLYISGGSVVPLVNETLIHLASGKTQNRLRPLNPGDPIMWTGPAHPPIESASLVAPDGTSQALQPQLRGDQYFINTKVFVPGLYQLRFMPASIPQPIYFAVNIDPRELDPTVVSAVDVDWFKQHHCLSDRLTAETLPAAFGAQRGGFELWWLLALLLFGLLVLEVVATWRLAKKQTDVNPETAGLVTQAGRAV